MYKTCLHVGFHKTATSYLQKHVFTNHPQINYLGKFERHTSHDGKPWVQMEFDNTLYNLFNNNFEDIEEKSKMDNSIELKENKLNFLSEERISSYFYYNGYDESQIFRKMQYIFDSKNDLKILLLLRNQADLLISRYSENLNLFSKLNRKWKKFNEFAKDINEFTLSYKEKYILDNFKYFQFINNLQNSFPKNKIGIFLYEDLKINPKDFFEKLFNFLEIKNIDFENVKEYSSLTFKGYYESKNNFFSSYRVIDSDFYKIKKIVKIPNFLVKMIKNVLLYTISYPNFIIQTSKNPIKKNKIFENNVKNFFMNDNENLSKFLNRDLKKLGY